MPDDLSRARELRQRRATTAPAGNFRSPARHTRAMVKAQQKMALADIQAGRALVVPHRITLALDMAGLFGPEVDAALGVEEPTVDLWEAGDLTPTAAQLHALADLTGFHVTYFCQPWTQAVDSIWICGADGCVHVDTDADPT